MEGDARKHCCVPYIGHVPICTMKESQFYNPSVLWGVVYELLVDSRFIRNVNSQWCIEGGGHHDIIRLHIHACHLDEMLQAGVGGSFRVTQSYLDSLANRAQEFDPNTSQYPRQIPRPVPLKQQHSTSPVVISSLRTRRGRRCS